MSLLGSAGSKADGQSWATGRSCGFAVELGVRAIAEPPDTSVSLASIDWTEQGKAIIELDLPEGRARHVTPSEDVFKFPLSVPAESRIGGLIFVYLNPRHDLEICKLSLDLLDGEHILGAVTLNLSAIYS